MTSPKAPYQLVCAFALENFCSQVLFIYTPLFVIFNGGDGVLGSFLRALAYIGPVLFGYYIGVLVDHFDKRWLGCSIALLLAAAAACYTLRLPDQTLGETFLFLGSVSIGTYFLNNLRASVMPSVARRAQLPRMNATLLVTENIALLAAPLIASLLLSASSPSVGFAVIAALFCLATTLYYFALANLPCVEHSPQALGTFGDNLRLLTSNKPLLRLVYVVMGNNAFVGVYLLYILIYAAETGLFDAAQVPQILIAYALGSILSGSTAEKAITLFGNRNLALLCCLLMAMGGSLPLWLPAYEVFFLSAFLVGFFAAYVVIAVWTLRQTLIPAASLGRVTGITSALFKLSMVVAIPIAGLLGESQGSAAAVVFGLAGILLGAIPLARAALVERFGKTGAT
ncbi:MFS transporter [Pseudomonas putida]|uniref:MFS transporter n=1 Tax=Pseudomonas putida TaxID=303 RepID=A0A4D6XDC1_PSEPU|nr:MFS transporter [Pseudomonas putida]QCI12668.1 MFS transporter [Pseudomonas putida]